MFSLSVFTLTACDEDTSNASTSQSKSATQKADESQDASALTSTVDSTSANTSGSTSTVVTKYTITFDANGHGTAPVAQQIEDGGKVTAPTAPTADGYDFGGWFKEAGCTNEWVFATQTVTQNVTLYAKWTLESASVTSIAVSSTSTHKTSFAKGVDFSSTGLVITATYSDTTTGTLTSAAYEVDSSAFNKTTLNTYTIVVKLTANSEITASYTVTVTAAEVASIAVSSTSTQQTSFVVAEEFNSTGLQINKVYTDATTEAVLPADYTLNSTAYDKTTVGNYSISIALNADATKTCNYQVSVSNYPFSGEYYMVSSETPQMVYLCFKIDTDGKCYGFNEETSSYIAEGDSFVVTRNADQKFQTTIDSKTYVYNPTTDTMMELSEDEEYKRINSETTVKISAVMSNGNMYTFLVPKDGSLSSASIALMNGVGLSIYTAATEGTLVTEEMTFSQNTAVYLLVPEKDYTGLPFVGTYYDASTKKVEINLADNGVVSAGDIPDLAYTATKIPSSENYTIDFAGGSATFIASDKTLLQTTKTYKQIASTQVIVKLVQSASVSEEYGSLFSGDYVIDSGEKFPLVLFNEYKLSLQGYANTQITSNQTFTVVSVLRSQAAIKQDKIFGTYLDAYFEFHREDDTLTYYENGASSQNAVYAVTDLTKTTMNISVDFNSASLSDFTAVVDSNTLIIESGEFAGTYKADELYKNCSFVARYENENAEIENSYFEIRTNGSVDYNADSSHNYSGNIKLLSKEGDIYTFEYTYYDYDDEEPCEKTKNVVIDMSFEIISLTFDSYTFNGPDYLGLAFVNIFGYQGKIIEIQADGTIIINGNSDYCISICDEYEDIFKIEYKLKTDGVSDAKRGTITYTFATETLTIDDAEFTSMVFEKIGEQATTYGLAFDYTKLDFVNVAEPTIMWRFDGTYRYVTIEDACIGRIVEFNDDSFLFRYNDGTEEEITLEYLGGKVNFTCDGQTYSANLPLVYNYSFINKTYVNGTTHIYIDGFDYATIDDESQPRIEGTVTACVQDANNIALTIRIDETNSQEWLYNSLDDTFTLPGDIVYRNQNNI